MYVLNPLQLVAEQRQVSELCQLVKALKLADAVEGQIQPGQVHLQH